MDKYVIGCDVSKNKLELALLLSVEPLKVRSKVVSNDHSGCMALIEWACRQAKCTAQQLHVVMEATGVYHEAAAYALLEAGVGVSVANPARVREFAKGLALRNKTDALDRMVLARYGATVKLPLWQPPAAEVVELKALLSRLEHPRLARDRQLLESIPAIGRKTANRMLCLLHARAFAAAPAAAAYLGLVPVQHRSGSSVYRPPHLSKAGPSAMRAALYMPAVVGTRANPDLRILYERLIAAGKSKMSALGAAMRKLVHICFGVLKNQQPYEPRLRQSA